jgi:hypothetical protein
MTFVTPALAIAGLAAVAIPIIIFLLWRQRRKPIEWAAMRFLLDAYRKHRRRLRLEQVILLAVRCLAVAAAGVALARPLLKSAGLLDPGGARIVYLVVDDGVAAGLQSSSGETSLDAHVARAREIVRALAPGDRVGIVTAARPARAVLSPPSTDHGAVADLLESMTASRAPTDLPGAIQATADALAAIDAQHERTFVYLLSDFRTGSAVLEERLPPALAALGDRVVLRATPPAAEAIGNVQITDVAPARRVVLAGADDGSGQIAVRLVRRGALDSAVTQVRVSGEGIATAPPRTVAWEPGQTDATVDFVVDFAATRDRETGLTVAIDGDALPADDHRHVVVALRRTIRVAIVDRRSFGFEPGLDRLGPGQWIHRALAPAENAQVDAVFVEPAAIDVADLRVADAAFLPRPDLLPDGAWSIIRAFVDGGGILFITPPPDQTVHRWTDHLRSDLGLPWQIEREVRTLDAPVALALDQPRSALLTMVAADLEELCRPVFATRMLAIDAERTQAETILAFDGGAPAMIAGGRTPSFGATNGGGTPPSGATGSTPPSAEPTAPGAEPDGSSRGLVIYLAVAPSLDWTNLPSKPLMVPLLHESLRQGISVVRSSRAALAGDRPALPLGPAAAALIAPGGDRIELEPAARPARALALDGLYRVVDAAAQDVGLVAVNVDARGADVAPQADSAVRAWLATSGAWGILATDAIAADLARGESGAPIAGILLAILLGLVLVETILARWFSHARTMAPGGAAGTGPGGLRPTMGERERRERAAIAEAGGAA